MKDPAVRLAAWIALLIGSLLIPVMMTILPGLPVHLLSSAAPVQAPQSGSSDFRATAPGGRITAAAQPASFNWYRAALMLYMIVGAGMLLRLCVGLILSWRILRRCRRTDRGFFTSPDIASPATLGILRPAIVLPEDWPQWDAGKLDSILAHERSHIERDDPAIQLLSAIHRALLWPSPAAWFLHSKIVRACEEVSDDAAIAVTADRAAYAGILIEFMQRRALPRTHLGVPMSRYGSTDRRIQRVLDSSTLSRGMTWLGMLTMLMIASPLAYFMATAAPAKAAQPAPQTRLGRGRSGGGGMPKTVSPASAGGVVGLGSVSASVVPVRTWIEGSLKSVNFQEGQMLHAGDLVAVVSGRASENQLASSDFPINAPVSGIAGLRLVEPGTMVRPTDEKAILTIAEVQPISVLFTLPESFVPEFRAALDSGRHATVEAWNNNSSAKLATGVLTAMDNQIDPNTGTIKLRATFENKDGKLFPNQFVNVHVLK